MNLKKLFNIAPYAKKVKDGFSNNSDYFGDWYGKGQIDYNAVINPDEEGELWMVKIWSGIGYVLDVYLVNAYDVSDAIDKVFEWSYENEGANKLVFDYDELRKRAKDEYEWEVKEGNTDMSYEDFEDEYINEHYIYNEDFTLFAYVENFFVDKVPQEYLNKEVSDSVDDKVSDAEDEIENWEDYRFTFTIYGNDGEIIDQFDGTDVYTELSDTLYDDDSAIELAKEALHNYAESYDGEGDKIVISVDADEYDMSADDYSGKVREVYSEEYDLKEDEISDSVDDDVDIDDFRQSLWSRTYNKLVNFAINHDMINVPIEVNIEDIKSIKVDDEGYITVITQYGDEDFIENYEDEVMYDIYNKVTNA